VARSRSHQGFRFPSFPTSPAIVARVPAGPVALVFTRQPVFSCWAVPSHIQRTGEFRHHRPKIGDRDIVGQRGRIPRDHPPHRRTCSIGTGRVGVHDDAGGRFAAPFPLPQAGRTRPVPRAAHWAPTRQRSVTSRGLWPILQPWRAHHMGRSRWYRQKTPFPSGARSPVAASGPFTCGTTA